MLKVIFLFVLIILIFGGLFFLFKNIKIQNITCSSQSGNCNKSLEKELTEVNKKNIFESLYLANNILKKNKNTLAYSINFELPFKLKISVIERVPVIAFKLNNGNYALIDKEGVMVNEAKSTNLPKILSSNELETSELVFITSLMKVLNSFYNVNTGKVVDNSLIVEVQSKKIIFPVTGDKDTLLGSLNLIFSRLRELQDASTISTIDLRFKNPVLR